MKDTLQNLIIRDTFFPSRLQIRNVPGTRSRTVEGYAIRFNSRSVVMYEDENTKAYEVIAPTAVTRQLLDSCDIKLTMFHDSSLMLGRSKNGKGTLQYSVDASGVKFWCDMPKTLDGDKALELVRRGDIVGCSFAFSTKYKDSHYVSATRETRGSKTIMTYTVKKITGIYDFTLAADPAYESTSVSEREFIRQLREEAKPDYRAQVAEMRRQALMI